MKNYYTLFLSFLLVSNVLAQNEFSFEVLSPNKIQAVNEPGSFTTAMDNNSFVNWGGEVIQDMVGPLAYAPADTGGNHFLCELPATDFSEKFVLIDRGICDFSLKAFHAQERGAIAVIIRNHNDELIQMAAATNHEFVDIPVILIPSSMGEGLAAALQSGIPVTVAFVLSSTTSIVNLNEEVLLNVFPNPMKTESVFELLENDFGNGKIEIYDLLGRLVREEIFFQNKFILRRKILKAGHYFYKILLDEKFSAAGKIHIVD